MLWRTLLRLTLLCEVNHFPCFFIICLRFHALPKQCSDSSRLFLVVELVVVELVLVVELELVVVFVVVLTRSAIVVPPACALPAACVAKPFLAAT